MSEEETTYEWTGGSEGNGLPYPTGDSPPDGAKQIKKLAEETADDLDGKADLTNASQTITASSFVGTGQVKAGSFVGAGTSDLNIRVGSDSAGQLVVRQGTTSTLTTVACADASYGNQAMAYGQYVNSSREFKTEIQTFSDGPDPGMLESFNAINPVRYRYKDEQVEGDWIEEHLLGTEHVGFIAEDVKDAGLGVVETSEGKVVGLRNDELIAVLWSKVQQLEQRVADLEAERNG